MKDELSCAAGYTMIVANGIRIFLISDFLDSVFLDSVCLTLCPKQ